MVRTKGYVKILSFYIKKNILNKINSTGLPLYDFGKLISSVGITKNKQD